MTGLPSRLATMERFAWYTAIVAGIVAFLSVDTSTPTGKALLITFLVVLLAALTISTVRVLRSGSAPSSSQ